MPSLTEFDRGAIRKLLNEANQIRRRSRMKIASEEKGAAPMLSQVGNVLKSSGIEHRAEIVKRILMKGKPLNPAVVKAGSAPPTSSHHEGPVRKRGKIETPQDDTNPKLAEFLKNALIMPVQGLRAAKAGVRIGRAEAAARNISGGARGVMKAEGVMPKSAPLRASSTPAVKPPPFGKWLEQQRTTRTAEPKAIDLIKQAISAQMVRGLTGGKSVSAAQALKQVRQPTPPPAPRATFTEHELAKRRRAGVIMTAEDARVILKLALGGMTG